MKSTNRQSPPARPADLPIHSRRSRLIGLLALCALTLLFVSLVENRTAAIRVRSSQTSYRATARIAGSTLEASGPVAAAIAQENAGPRLERILIKPSQDASPAALDAVHASIGAKVQRSFQGLGGMQVVELPSGTKPSDAVATYQRSGLVQYAEPDHVVHLMNVPNDFRYWDESLWNLHNTGIYGGTPGADIKAEGAWDVRTNASSIIVAVIDTGIRATHEDLAANMWVNTGETGLDSAGRPKATNRFDDDGDGYIDDVNGINVVDTSGGPYDLHGHGTHVAGIIGAVGNNTVGVTGVAWNVKLMALKFANHDGEGTVSDAIACIEYARAHGAKVINASWGDYDFTSTALRDAISGLRDAGIVFVAAVGNDGTDNDTRPLFPASYEFDNIVAAAATDRVDARAAFSNFGHTTVDIGAPGNPVYSTWAGSDTDYRYCFGTSMAAPHIAGAVALLMAEYPNETPQQIINRIISTADPLPDLTGTTVSGGRLNLAAAMMQNMNSPVFALQPVSQTAQAGGSVTFSVTTSVPSTYQWMKNGVAIAGATGSSLTLNGLTPDSAGSYTVSATTSGGTVTSQAAVLSIQFGRITALSVRSLAGSGDSTLIAGLVMNGSASKQVIFRGVSSTLTAAGVQGVLPDPQLGLFSGATQVAANDNWGGGSAMAQSFATVGLAPLAANSPDAALLSSLAPGAYTAQLSGTSNATGIALLEMYDTDPANFSSGMSAVSVRSFAGTGSDVLIVGVVVTGNAPKRVVIRGIGPSLGASVPTRISDSQLQLYSGSNLLVSNDDWGGGTDLVSAFASVGLPTLAANSKDAAVIANLNPGVYTIHVSGVGNSSGIALVELYEIP